jgi:WD repeat-containing protein 76
LGNLGVFDASQKIEVDDDGDRTAAIIHSFKLHARTISDFKFHPSDSSALYTASYDSSIRKLDLNKDVAVEVYADANEEPLSGVEIPASEPHMLYFSTLEGRMGFTDMRDPKHKETFQLHDKKIGGFSLHPNLPHLVATASLDRTMKLWDLRKISGGRDVRMPALLGEHTSKLSVSCALWNAAGQVVTSSYDDTLKIHSFPAATSSGFKAGTALSDEEMTPTNVIRHNNQTGRWVTILRPQWQQRPNDGINKFVVGNMNRYVDVYSASGEQLAQLGGDGITAVPAVAEFHPSMPWVAGGSGSGKLALWMPQGEAGVKEEIKEEA